MRKIGALCTSAALALGLLAGTSATANAVPDDTPAGPVAPAENLGAAGDTVQAPGAGDPIYGDAIPRATTASPFSFNTSALTVLSTWKPALTTNAATAAYVDVAADRVYQASRSESPALLFANSLSESSNTEVTTLPDTTGSWDMTMNGKYLAVGTNGNGVKRPSVVVFDTSKEWGSPLRTAVLPSTSSASAYVMSLAADWESEQTFWVGTYDPVGARLYRLDTQTGEMTDFTPGTQWQETGIKYLRSLAATPQGVVAGMGNPGSVWFLANDASEPVEVDGALDGLEASSVYALASFPRTAPTLGDVKEEPSDLTALNDAERAAEDRPSGDAGATAPDDVPMSGDNELQEVWAESTVDERNGESTTYLVAGTNTPASVSLLTPEGANSQSHLIGGGARTVDRIAIDDNGIAWFTVRPSGDLYSWDLSTPDVQPVRRSATAKGAETRALNVTDGVVRGVTGMRQLWTYTSSSGSLNARSLDRGDRPEATDTAPQGILRTDSETLVGGHWRYMVHTPESTFDVDLPGEPKAQTLVDGRIYSAIYPSASVFEVDVASQIATFVAGADTTQVRPRALVWNAETKRLYMATSGVYGSYGGAISVINPTNGHLEQYPTPVDNQMPFALAPVARDLIVGTSAAGEAVGAPSGARTWIVRWSPNGVLWRTSTADNGAVASVGVIHDAAGDFVFALTSSGKVLALDADSGEILWTSKITGASTFDSSNGYLTVRANGTLTEYFPSRTALVKGLDLATNVSWIDLQGELSQSLTLATVESKAVSAGVAEITDPRQVTRTRGDDRYATALAVSRSTYRSASTAVIATGVDFPDALSAGPLAAQRGGPVLLTYGNYLDSELLQELNRLGVKTIFVAGGTGAVPAGVENELIKQGFSVKRLGGKNRFQTSLKIAEEVRAGSGKSAIPVVVTTGTVFPDALSATPAAAQMGAAIVLSNENTLVSEVTDYLRSSSVTYAVAVGGPARAAANGAGISLKWSAVGKDRFGTSARVMERVFPNATHAHVATGMDFPDGLAAGPAAFVTNGPVLLSQKDVLPPAVAGELRQTKQVTLVGGTGVLSQQIAFAIRNAN